MSPICPTLLLLLAMLPSTLLAQTTDRMVTAFQEALETRLAAQTASIETRLAAQTASLEDRLEDSLAAQTTALHEKIASLEVLLTAATRDIGDLVTAFQDASSQMAKCCESPATTATRTQTPATTPRSTVKPSTTPATTETPTTTPTTTETPTTTPTTTETPTTTPATTETPRGVVFLRRQDGSVDFYQGWAAYKSGFGNQGGEFWLGLDNLHTLTTSHNYGLRADLTDWSGETKWAEYSTFRVAGETDGYRLTVSGYNSDSTAGNSMSRNNGQRFTTRDRDYDTYSNNCADYQQGAWWYWFCTNANPAGPYKPAGYTGQHGIFWYHAYNDVRSLKRVTLTLVNA